MSSVIQVEHLAKQYQLGLIGTGTLREDLHRWWARVREASDPVATVGSAASARDTLWALRDVSFSVGQGEVLGIIGRNGAGKSTLLKILSRVTAPTAGSVSVRGRIASLLEVGTGFHPELTGRDNIFLNGAILGMTKMEIRAKFDEIVAFSEVEKFIDTPVKRYSSGMYVRLAFAVAAHLEPEILVVDEVLAVGDSAFQKKCLGKMGEVSRHGRTVLFVSHNMSAVKALCPNVLWIEAGRVQQIGNSHEVVANYLGHALPAEAGADREFAEDTSKEFQLRRARMINPQGEVLQNFSCDEPIRIELQCQVHRRIPGLYGYLMLSKLDGTEVLESDSYDVAPNPLDELPVGLHTFSISIPSRSLAPGDYAVYLNFTSLSGLTGFNIDSPGTVFTFHLDDHTSRRGNRRSGCLSALLPWAPVISN